MEEFKGDKRTKAYKEWKAKYDAQSSGVGDTIQKITKATGIEAAVKFIAGEDCGCDERRKKLNAIFPYEKPLCFNEEEYLYLDEIFKLNKRSLSADQNETMVRIYNRVFRQNREPSGCGSCFRNEVYNTLKNVYLQYQ